MLRASRLTSIALLGAALAPVAAVADAPRSQALVDSADQLWRSSDRPTSRQLGASIISAYESLPGLVMSCQLIQRGVPTVHARTAMAPGRVSTDVFDSSGNLLASLRFVDGKVTEFSPSELSPASLARISTLDQYSLRVEVLQGDIRTVVDFDAPGGECAARVFSPELGLLSTLRLHGPIAGGAAAVDFSDPFQIVGVTLTYHIDESHGPVNFYVLDPEVGCRVGSYLSTWLGQGTRTVSIMGRRVAEGEILDETVVAGRPCYRVLNARPYVDPTTEIAYEDRDEFLVDRETFLIHRWTGTQGGEHGDITRAREFGIDRVEQLPADTAWWSLENVLPRGSMLGSR